MIFVVLMIHAQKGPKCDVNLKIFSWKKQNYIKAVPKS